MPSNQKLTFTPQNPQTPGTDAWFYDEIMRAIEPDLMLNVIPTHAEKYKDETQEERGERIKSYDKAFLIFDRVVIECEDEIQAGARKVRKQVQEKATKRERKERVEELKKIEEELQTTDDSNDQSPIAKED